MRIAALVGTLARSQAGFCLLSALAMVGLRVALFDYQYFNASCVPNHDMSQGLAFFATNMHSMRLTGDLAWWNPVTNNGYAQYYQSFLSPLAPTSHHVVFIVWAQAVRALSFAGVVLPEYVQYVAVNFLVLPFLAFAAFGWFTSLLFRSRVTQTLVLLTYTLSGIGLWNSAWFYFQEPFSLFFVLAACLAALRRPGVSRLAVLAAAVVIQLTSFNYWTMYNTFFMAVVLGSYAWVYPDRLRRLASYTAALVARHRVRAAAGMMALLAVVGVWAGLMAATVAEQKTNYMRTTSETKKEFNLEDAYARVPEIRTCTTELFNPFAERAVAYPVPEEILRLRYNDMHRARYVGCVLLPLLLLVPLRRWGRRDRWLVLCTVGVFVICLAPPLLLYVWQFVPMMNSIRHLFYFYSQYWQLLLVLLAGSSLETLLRRQYDAETGRRFAGLLLGVGGLLAVLLAGFAGVSHLFPVNDKNLQANLYFAVLTLLATAAYLQLVWQPTAATRRLVAAAVLALAAADLTRYFWQVCALDRVFSAQHTCRVPGAPSGVVPEEIAAVLLRPWPAPDAAVGFTAGLRGCIPFANSFWPQNHFMAHVHYREAEMAQAVQDPPPGPALQFYPRAERVETAAEVAARRQADPGQARNCELLLVQDPTADVGRPPAGGGGELTYRFCHWDYNAFAFDVTVPRDGWLFIDQMPDALWRVTLDGRPVTPARANLVGSAVPVGPGRYWLQMKYRPLARRLYWPACWLLEGCLVVLGAVAVLGWRRAARGSQPTVRITPAPYRQAA